MSKADALTVAYAEEYRLRRALRFSQRLVNVLSKRTTLSPREYRLVARLDRIVRGVP